MSLYHEVGSVPDKAPVTPPVASKTERDDRVDQAGGRGPRILFLYQQWYCLMMIFAVLSNVQFIYYDGKSIMNGMREQGKASGPEWKKVAFMLTD